MPTLHLRITGRVQGVGYRAGLMHMAGQLALRGWVRNRSDGSVEALVDGPAPACEALVAWAQRGPPAARVAAVDVNAAAVANGEIPADFDCRPTL